MLNWSYVIYFLRTSEDGEDDGEDVPNTKLPLESRTPSFANYGSTTSMNKPKIAFAAEAEQMNGNATVTNGAVNGYVNKGMDKGTEATEAVVPMDVIDQGKFISKYT